MKQGLARSARLFRLFLRDTSEPAAPRTAAPLAHDPAG